MKHVILVFLSLSLCFSLCFSSFAQEKWLVDNPHSNVRFEAGWEDFSMRTGEFKAFDGAILFQSRGDFANAGFEFVVDATSVDVISDRLADHVKSEKFLDVENHPTITYSSSSVEQTSDSTYISKGKLNIVGIEKDQDVSIWVKGFKESTKGDIYGLEVTLVVNRSDFGLDWGSPRLGDTVKIVGHLLYKIEEEEKK